jgi:hypothetical protein
MYLKCSEPAHWPVSHEKAPLGQVQAAHDFCFPRVIRLHQDNALDAGE